MAGMGALRPVPGAIYPITDPSPQIQRFTNAGGHPTFKEVAQDVTVSSR